MTRIYDIADKFVDRYAALSPNTATAMGVPGYEDQLTDYSPEGVASRAELASTTLRQLRAAAPENERDRIARDAMTERLELGRDEFERGEHFRVLSVIASPFQGLRQVFDLMPRETEEHWRNIAARMNVVPEALDGVTSTLREGQTRDMTASQRQARECALQAEAWTGMKPGSTAFFSGLVAEYDRSGISDEGLKKDLDRAAERATAAYADGRDFLLKEYLPNAVEKDAVGEERYALAARGFNGAELDLDELYRWGWEQLEWVEREMAATAERITPGVGVEAVVEMLGTDPKRSIEGEEPFREWMQNLQEETIEQLDGTHFEIPERVRKIECLIAPPGGALAMYYTGPSEDFSRPGRVWYPTGGKTRFPLWIEVSIAYHEGVPGHHFQIATTVHLSDRLSRYQRLLGGTSGHAEGWGLYAEKLMGELGYLENPEYYLGMLISQAFRSARVIIDIGMHLELEIPADQPFHPGERWTPELGLEFLLPRCPFEDAFARSEITRYLGWPGQAISYKVGERAWLAAREDARRRQGAEFDLRAWHTRALDLGPMGLDQMSREMAGGA